MQLPHPTVNRTSVAAANKFKFHLFERIPRLDQYDAQPYSVHMSDKKPPKIMSDQHNSFHAEKRRARRDAASGSGKKQSGKGFAPRKSFTRENTTDLLLYGLHTVRHALLNPKRAKLKLFATTNGLNRLELETETLACLPVEEKSPRELDRMVGTDAVHQGVVLHTEPLKPRSFEELADTDLVLVLDQVTDPHNVGAIFRSAVAMNAGAIITTSRHSPVESGVLAKSASGALEMIDHIEVRNLAEAIENLHIVKFSSIGLDSEGPGPIENLNPADKIALVLGSEGKGLRQKTRETCNHLARLDVPGEIKSLNVSNAAVLALYVARTQLISR